MSSKLLRIQPKGLFFLFGFLLFGWNINAQSCDTELAHWDLESCEPDTSYNEFTADVMSPTGMTTEASVFSNLGHHSCNPGLDGNGMCHSIEDDCTWSDNNPNAFRFSVTVTPDAGYRVNVSGLCFGESAPLNYLWLTGQTGDNDPPSLYGVRVLKDGVEIWEQTNQTTSAAWSLEEFDFSGNADFTTETPATYSFEILGYCRQANSPVGFAVWDVDEIKVKGCAELIDPCGPFGGDMDGDGVCADDDCDDNNPNISNPGDMCDDGDANTTNDVIQADCTCSGTPVTPVVDCPNLNANIGDSCDDGNPNTSNDVVQANCTCAGTPVNPGVDCPNLNANIGDACDDGNPNTNNDVVQANCSCAGTPVTPPPGPGCNGAYSVSGRKITVTGLDDDRNSVKVIDANNNILYECNDWNGPACGNMTMYTVPADGKYFVQIQTYNTDWTKVCDIFEMVTIGNPPPPPGTCVITANVSNLRCDGPGTFSFDVTASSVNGGAWGYDILGTNIMMIPNGNTVTVSGVSSTGGTLTYTVIDHDKPSCTTTISVVPISCSTSSTTGPASKTCNAEIHPMGQEVEVTGLNNAYVQVKVIDDNWQEVFFCDSWENNCDGEEAKITLSEPGTYYVGVVTFDESWMTVCRQFEKVEYNVDGTETTIEPGIKIYPNPAQNNVNVDLKGYEGKNIEILILNQFGTVAKSFQFDDPSFGSIQLPIANLKNGVYSIVVLSSGMEPSVQRLIVGKDYHSAGAQH